MGERFGSVDGKFGQDLAVQGDAEGLQAPDESAVRGAVDDGRRLDPDDPEAAEIPLFGPPVAVGVEQGLLDRLFGCPVVAALGAEVSLARPRTFLRRSRLLVLRFTRGMVVSLCAGRDYSS